MKIAVIMSNPFSTLSTSGLECYTACDAAAKRAHCGPRSQQTTTASNWMSA